MNSRTVGVRFNDREREQLSELDSLARDPKCYATVVVPSLLFRKLMHTPRRGETRKAWLKRLRKERRCVSCGEPSEPYYCAGCAEHKKLLRCMKTT